MTIKPEPQEVEVTLGFTLERKVSLRGTVSEVDNMIDEVIEEMQSDAQQCLQARLELNEVNVEPII